MTLRRQPMVPMREDLLALFDRAELKKYLTDEELPRVSPAAELAQANTAAELAQANEETS